MPILMPTDTAELFAACADKFDSRSLLLDRFVYDHPIMDEARRLHFSRVCEDSFHFVQETRAKWQKDCHQSRNETERKKLQAYLDDTAALARQTVVAGPAEPRKVSESKQAFLDAVAAERILHAKLQSRLMVNMAGGVMENAGLCLDRFGLPYIPGSAVKGCARRAALAALHEWCEAGGKPEHKPTGTDNLAPCCAGFTTPAEMLTAIARVFGWCEQDWSDQSNQSDFAWSCSGTTGSSAPRGRDMPAQGNALGRMPKHNPSPEGATQKWSSIRDTVVRQLADKLCISIPDKESAPWKSLPNFAGSVSFLPAYPVDLDKTAKVDGLPLDVPPLGKLELDVVTVHHKHYYAEPAEPKDVPHSHEKWQRWKQEHDAWERQWGTAPDVEEPVPNVFPAVAPGHVFTFALAPLRGADATLLQHARTWLKLGLETFGLGAKTNAGYGWFADVTEAISNLLKLAARKPEETLLAEFRGWTDKQIRAAARAFSLQNEQFWPKSGREATEEYRFTLVWFILNEKKALFDAEKNHAGSDFAKGVRRLAEKTGLTIE